MAVIVGASVGGFLAVVILVLMVVKCVRRKKEQKLSTDDLKTEEEVGLYNLADSENELVQQSQLVRDSSQMWSIIFRNQRTRCCR